MISIYMSGLLFLADPFACIHQSNALVGGGGRLVEAEDLAALGLNNRASNEKKGKEKRRESSTRDKRKPQSFSEYLPPVLKNSETLEPFH